MKTVLLGTTSLWNCGDDFIREGVLELLQLKSGVRTLWWNRGYGIKNAYANDLDTNLPLIDYFIAAGTPEWMYKNERIYRYCLKHRIPFSIIGVGTRNIFGWSHRNLVRKLAKSGLCEAAFARDKSAFRVLEEFGFRNKSLILDPAFFMRPLETKKTTNIFGWRDYYVESEPSFPFRYPHKWLFKQLKNKLLRGDLWGKSKEDYTKLLLELFSAMPEPKMVIVHDNREVKKAEKLFGAENVFYSSNYRDIFRKYSHAISYIGTRIHGAIPSMIHGAQTHLIYGNLKADVLKTSIEILSNYLPNISKNVKLKYLKDKQLKFEESQKDSSDQKTIGEAISKEKQRIREILRKQPVLGEFIL